MGSKIRVSISRDLYTQAEAAAADSGLTAAAWITFAINSYLRKWKPSNRSDEIRKLRWPNQCSHCGLHHDPEDHFRRLE